MSGPAVLRNLFLFIILSLLVASQTFAQRDNDPMLPGSVFEVSGQVLAANNRTIQNVTVRLESASGALVDEGTADSTGRFRFSRLRSGQYKISAKAAGAVAFPQILDVTRASPRIYVMLQLVPETATFGSRETGRSEVVDARVPAKAAEAFAKAQTAFDNSKLDEAVLHLQKAVSIYPQFYLAQFLLGKIYMDKNQWDNAAKALSEALKINRDSIRSLVLLGEVYRRQKKYEQAQKVLDDAIKLDRNSWEANYTLGRVYWETNNFPKSGFHIARTLELQPSLAEAHLLAGNIFIRAGLPDNALIEYEEYLRLSPKGEFSEQTRELVAKLKKSQRLN
ncbi:MAG TPA: tetratricopeptide repeat protein [Pyrinomonadaceae bacterium]|nr:tetratricopeptide repeat protein [Pyrinomonadaceae bacterium]